MHLVIKDEGAVPADHWHYLVPSTGVTVKAPNYPALYPEILRHCATNELPAPSEQEVVDWCCANLKIACIETETRKPLINKFTLELPVVQQGCCGSK